MLMFNRCRIWVQYHFQTNLDHLKLSNRKLNALHIRRWWNSGRFDNLLSASLNEKWNCLQTRPAHIFIYWLALNSTNGNYFIHFIRWGTDMIQSIFWLMHHVNRVRMCRCPWMIFSQRVPVRMSRPQSQLVQFVLRHIVHRYSSIPINFQFRLSLQSSIAFARKNELWMDLLALSIQIPPRYCKMMAIP